jgi:uncharacterized membrane protein
VDPATTPLPEGWGALGWTIAVAILAGAIRRADWTRILRSETAHAYFGTLFLLVVLWSMRASIGSASLHLLGVGGLCLAAGPALALFGGAVVVAIVTLLRESPPANVGIVFVVLVALPVAVQYAVLTLIRRLLPRNPFAWFFGVAFLGAALSFFAGALAGGAVAGLAAPARMVASGDFTLFVMLLAFGEGTLSGMLLTLGVVYRPAWIATFDDARDLERRDARR